MMALVVALWPQPGHSVVLLPSYSARVSPSRLTGWLACVVVALTASLLAAAVRPLPRERSSCRPMGRALVSEHALGDGARVERQAIVVEHAVDARRPLGSLEPDALGQLSVAVLLDHVDALVPPHELGHARRQRQPAHAHVRRGHARRR